MLVLTRKIHQAFFIDVAGMRIEIVLLHAHRGQARIGIQAPQEAVILREEIARERAGGIVADAGTPEVPKHKGDGV